MNNPRNLSLEATYINHNFSQQVWLVSVCRLVAVRTVIIPAVVIPYLCMYQVLFKEERFKFENPNPFLTEDENPATLASVAYR